MASFASTFSSTFAKATADKKATADRKATADKKAVAAKRGAKVAIVMLSIALAESPRAQIPGELRIFNICVHFCVSLIAFLHSII